MAQPPNLLAGPEPVETANLHFKLICKLKIFEPNGKYEEGECSVLAVSQHYGLVFVGNLNGFSVIRTKHVNGDLDFNNYPKLDITLNLRPSHISVDFTQKFLAVVCNSKPCSVLILYNIASFSPKDLSRSKVTPLSKVAPNPTAGVVELAWQPKADGILILCMSDGSVVGLSQEHQDSALCTLPNTTQATCICWSPKGKQIVIGSAVGTISQYKPDLKLVKTLPAPPLFNGAVTVVNILWISSFQFIVAYNDRSSPESFPVLTIYNAIKNEPVNVINYEDITFSNTLFRNHQIYMIHNSAWNLIFVSSANSIEVAVLHSVDGQTWEQWLLGDASRAELPLNADKQETFPLGLAFDFTSDEKMTWGEKTLPPMPRLYLLSDEGILCIFNVLNTIENASQLCSLPKESVDDTLFTNKTFTSSVPEPPKSLQALKTPIVQSTTTFGNTAPTYTFGTGFPSFTSQPQSSTPQVTISIQGGPVLGSVKDASLILQQQQQQQQGQQSSPMLTIKQQTPQILSIQQPPQQPPQILPVKQQSPQVLIPQQNIAPSSVVVSTTPSIFKAPPTLSISAPKVNPLFAAKQSSTPASTQNLKSLPPQGDIFGGKNLFQSTPIKQPESAPEKATIKQPPPSNKFEKVIDPSGKEDEVSVPEQLPSGALETPELPAVDDSVYWGALHDEIAHFNSELQQLSGRMGTLVVKVGTEEDKSNMKKGIDGLFAFWKELKDTTLSQSNEIHLIVMDLMEAFAWLEDAKSRNLQRKNPSFIELKKSEELDPLSARHMNEISHLKYYIENQLKQLMAHVEKEWMDHQENYRMEVKNRMAVPPLEEVYKTMHYQLKILDKQRTLLEELKEKVSIRKRNNKSHASLIVKNCSSSSISSQGFNRISELSKLAENLLQLKITKAESHPKFETLEVMKYHLKTILERSKKLTFDKQAALRDVLSERDMVKIRPVKTTYESSSFLRSLPLEKDLKKATKAKPETKTLDSKEKEKLPPSPVIKENTFHPKPRPKVNSTEAMESREKVESAIGETPKSIFVFGSGQLAEKPTIPPMIQSLSGKPEDNSPLATLTGIVKNIGKEIDSKPRPQVSTFTFGSSNFQKQETPKETVSRAQEVEPKTSEATTTKPFTFGISESVFGKTEPLKFGTKLTFGLPASTPAAPSTPTVSTATSSSSVSVSTISTAAPSFSFSFTPTTTANSSAFPKMNLFASGKEQSSGAGTKPPATNLFTSNSNTSASIFGSSTPIFGTVKSIPETKSITPMFNVPKTTSEAVIKTSGFTFTQPVESKTTETTEGIAATLIKPTAETEEVEVLVVEEEVKKSEANSESLSKNSPKSVIPAIVDFGGAVEPVKSAHEATLTTTFVASVAPPNVQATSTTSTSVVSSTTNIFTKPATSTSTETPTTSESPSLSQPTVKLTTSTFSFSTSSPIFGQTAATTTVVTTTASIFGQSSTTTTSIFGQVSSTTPSTNIFGGATPTTPTTNIFGGSAKPIFGQASVTTTSVGSIFGGSTPTPSTFGGSTPTTNAFGQTSTSTASPSTFGQKPDAVAQTANIFGQLLSDSNRAGGVFGTTSGTATTTSNIFSTPKNIFGGASTTTAPLFGTSSSIFPQTTSVFGQATTASSIFGQSQTSTSNVFFGQSVCSPFGGGTTVTSNQSTFENGGFNSKPIFGQSLFGQTSSNTIFGGSPTSSIFGGSSTSSPSGGNLFQTATTTTATTSSFGSTSPGPFSSGQGSVAETGFSAGNSFQKPLGGFGSPPVFGGAPSATPSFGAAPPFSGSTSFGSPPTFGSRPGVFDSSQGGFNQSPGRSTTFENLANQNTVGFGNLAQQSQNQSFGGVGGFGSSTFENKPAFGGNSFSSWR